MPERLEVLGQEDGTFYGFSVDGTVRREDDAEDAIIHAGSLVIGTVNKGDTDVFVVEGRVTAQAIRGQGHFEWPDR